jgi:hypothetical protein
MAPPIGPDANRITQDAHRVAVEIDISEIAGRLEREALRLVNDYSQQGLAGDELTQAVQDGLRALSPTPVDRAASGARGEAFNLGRNLGIQQNPDAVAQVIRTEVLDQNTCAYCLKIDGRVVAVNSDEYFQLMPPNGCAGREQCRGFYIPVAA